jgi:hypothetical protein
MPGSPARALLLGSAMALGGDWIRRGTRVLCGVAALAAVACFAIFIAVRNLPTPGDISGALSQHPSAYTLSLGHMLDLTFDSFAYLRLPLLVAAVGFLAGAIGTMRWLGQRAFLSAALMMVLFFHAARLALVVFDPYLTSRPLAQAILQAPAGKLIVARPYYAFSSLLFYTNQEPLILNGRFNNLEYGSYAPGSPDVFIGDVEFKQRWRDSQLYFLVAYPNQLQQLENLVGHDQLNVLASSGGKLVFTNHPLGHLSVARGMHE